MHLSFTHPKCGPFTRARVLSEYTQLYPPFTKYTCQAPIEPLILASVGALHSTTLITSHEAPKYEKLGLSKV